MSFLTYLHAARRSGKEGKGGDSRLVWEKCTRFDSRFVWEPESEFTLTEVPNAD